MIDQTVGMLTSTLGVMLGALAPMAPWLVPAVAALITLSVPMPGRGPGDRRRDPWRGFKYEPRRIALERAGGRCEGAEFIAWGRCEDPAVEVDHVYPWSRGGATVLSNAQALCKGHNRTKSSITPPWWYLFALEKRRRGYFPPDSDVRVSAAMNAAERASRAKAAAPRARRSR